MGHYEGYFSDFLFKFCNNMVLLPYVSQLSNVTSQLKDIYGLHVGVQLMMIYTKKNTFKPTLVIRNDIFTAFHVQACISIVFQGR
jgi:hypothetical protein